MIVNKSSTSTSENSKLFRTDESATNGANHINHENGNHSYNNQDDFSVCALYCVYANIFSLTFFF